MSELRLVGFKGLIGNILSSFDKDWRASSPFEGGRGWKKINKNTTTMLIRQAQPIDAHQIANIYNHYIAHTVITFEMEPVSEVEMQSRILDKQKKHDWLVLENEGKILGYAYYGTFRDRSAYDTTTESTVYLHPQETGKGYGKLLMAALIENARQKNYRELIAGIALPNDASEKLHKNLGFDQVAHFKNIGLKFDKWIDVIFLQKTL